MSSEKKPGTAGSGQHKIVLEFRKKLESIADTQLVDLEKLNTRLGRMAKSSAPPPKMDPRREPDDDEIPVVEGTVPPPPKQE
jgi:hypothetical protein